MTDRGTFYDKDNTEAGIYADNLIYTASADGQICIDRLQELAVYKEITEEKFSEILCELRDMGTEILTYAGYPFDREHYKNMLKEIRMKEKRSGGKIGEDPIWLYFEELESLPILSRNDERDMIFDIADGEEDKKEMLIESCMYIPVETAYRYVGHDTFFLDLVQEGNMELMAAAEEFDYDRNISFIAYAAFRVNRKLIESCNSDKETIRLPSELAGSIAEILKENKKSMREDGRELTDEELSEKLNIPVEKITAAKEVLERFSSIDKAVQS